MTHEPVWPRRMVLGWLGDDVNSVPQFSSSFSTKTVICGHCFVTTLTLNIKTAHIAAHGNAVILVVTV